MSSIIAILMIFPSVDQIRRLIRLAHVTYRPVALLCSSEHEVANIEPFFKTRASAHTGGELLSTSLPVCVLVEQLLVESFFQDDCSYVWQVSAAERCEWVRNAEDCYSDSVIQYTVLLFCYFGSEDMVLFAGGLVLVLFWLLFLFLILATTADNFFCPALAVIASVMHLSDSIAGVTILAFGNGAPDIFTSLVSRDDEEIIMFTELIGAGVFVTSMIAGSVAITKPFKVSLRSLMRDACFYIVSVCWINYVVWDEMVYLWEAVSFILVYVLFIVAVVIMQMYDTREQTLKTRIPSVPDPDVLHTYLANRDTGAIPKIPGPRSRPFGLAAKLDIAVAMELERARMRGEPVQEITDYVSDRPKGLFKEFFYDINPISKEDWKRSSKFVKTILIIRSPVMLLLQLFIPVVNPTVEKRGWSKLLNCFQLCATPTIALFLLNERYIFWLHKQDCVQKVSHGCISTRDGIMVGTTRLQFYFNCFIAVWQTTFGNLPVMSIFLVVGTVIGVIVFLTTHVDRVPKFHNVFAFLGFLGAMLTVYLVAGEVMAVLQCIGYACSISDAMLGITFLAWGNSIGDLISNVAIARRGFPRMGYAACFGGPMFNTLLGLGLTYGIAAATDPEQQTKIRISDMAPGCLAFLLCSLVATIIYLNITGATARRSYGGLLYSIYFAFILIQFLSELHVIHPLGTDHRPDI
ncbi:mitochondrial sodium/calcium exchanger protein-like [Monomorium pharaonis]|uniref:mitochondrial sodium/calcium exchanger protein-like n=1 Tax=Monomorium pharaonis TaxID=307658 RepID=UPI0017475EFA|nr:mitochondrial sodium/calcium exchanger protein-like [Monomorium pharaonis]